MQERNGAREMVGTVLDLHWEDQKIIIIKKKTGETGFLSRAVI